MKSSKTMKIRGPLHACSDYFNLFVKGIQCALAIIAFAACSETQAISPEAQMSPTVHELTATTISPESQSTETVSTREPTPTIDDIKTPIIQVMPIPVCPSNRLVFNMSEGAIEKAPSDGLYIGCSDGSYIYQFTNTSPSIPSVSPDGRRIALAINYITIEETRAFIEIIDLTTGNDILTLENTLGDAIWSPSWSPNSEYVLYRKSLLDQDFDSVIEAIHVDSDTVSQVLVENEIYHSALSPDGQHIVFSTIDKTIYIMGIECDHLTHLCKQSEEPHLISGGDQPSWSPDGDKIVVVSAKPESFHETLRLMDVEGNLIQEFDLGLWFIVGPVWSPDGNMIAFSATQEEGGGNDIYILSLDDSSLINLTIDTELVVGPPAWFPASSN